MLTIGCRLINAFHLSINFIIEELWKEHICRLGMLDINFICWVAVIKFFSSRRLPLVRLDKILIEDFLGINLD
jgi:hypothetical protein